MECILDDILSNIFNYLIISDIKSTILSCKRFRRIILKDYKYIDADNVPIPFLSLFIKARARHILMSDHTIIPSLIGRFDNITFTSLEALENVTSLLLSMNIDEQDKLGIRIGGLHVLIDKQLPSPTIRIIDVLFDDEYYNTVQNGMKKSMKNIVLFNGSQGSSIYGVSLVSHEFSRTGY
jgi:hypothetical protein